MWGTQWAGSCQDSNPVMQKQYGQGGVDQHRRGGGGGLKDVSGHQAKMWTKGGGGGELRQGLDRFRGGPALPGVT